ncbi:MAG: Aminopeptidase 2 mitochondrial [Vezdaea aestivalis]|nr:MAG: Aminopeptidase 2 mitochondrial [Vezdaea aestivalis]
MCKQHGAAEIVGASVDVSGGREVLPANVRPLNYDLKLEPNFDDFTYKGEVVIDLDVVHETTSIALNTLELDLHSTTVSSGSDVVSSSPKVSYNQSNQTTTISFDKSLPGGSKAQLRHTFTGQLNDKMAGFYRSSYNGKDGKPRYIATSQMEPTDARRAFPCFDEPALKATFDITLVADNHLTCLSNMDVHSQTHVIVAGKSKKAVKFNRTPLMSTYLLAFIVGELNFIESNSFRVPVRVYATPDKNIEDGRFSLELGARTLAFYEETFKSPFPLPKMDMAAIPDFSAGAMENWGLVTYRVVDLMFDQNTSGASTKQRVAEVVQHELAHQWFGNLVTMDFWDGLWLNEGFATWMSWYSCNEFYPEWKVWESYVTDNLQSALSLDSLRSSHPIEVPVKRADEINQIFDAISYSKGSCVLRMISKFLGEDVFMEGIRRYLKQHAFSNTTTGDLWAALSDASGKDVERVMDIWTKNVGFPVLTVTENEDSIHVKQNRFLRTSDVKPEEDKVLFPCFLALRTKDGIDGELTLSEREANFKVPDLDFFKLNADHSGIYRTSYSPARLQKLGEAAKKGLLSVEDRAGTIADAGALASSGYQKTSGVLALVKSFNDEPEYVVWNEILTRIATVKAAWVFEDPKVLDAIKAFQRALVSDKAHKAGWSFKDGEDHIQQQFKSLLFSTAGLSGDQKVIGAAFEMFGKFVAGDRAAIHPNIRSAVYSIVLQYGGANDYDVILNEYRTSSNSDERNTALRSLGRAKDPELIKRTLALALSDDVKQQDIYIPISALRTHAAGIEALFAWMQTNWDFLYKRLPPGLSMLGSVVQICTSSFTHYDQLEQVQKFFDGRSTKGFDQGLAQSKDSIKAKAAWLDRDREDVAKWLEDSGLMNLAIVRTTRNSTQQAKMDEQEFEALLKDVLQPDTAKVKNATARLRKDFYPKPESLQTIFHILEKHPLPQMRQLAAVQSRTLALQHWENVPDNAKPQIRQALLQSTLNEKSSLVRHGASRLIAALATMDFEVNQWQDLPQILEQAATSQNVAHREVGVYVIYSLLELMADSYAENLGRFFSLFEKTIKDPESFEVRLNTLLALGTLAAVLDEESDPKKIKAFHAIFPQMVIVLKQAVDANDDKQTSNAFRIFGDLLNCDPELLNPHFAELVQFMIQLATTTESSEEARTEAVSFLQQCVVARRMKIQSLKVGEQLTLMAMKIAVEFDGEKKESDDDITPGRAALALIDVMASLLPPPHVVVPLMKAFPEFINSENLDHRRAGILCLGFCAEGAPDFLSTQINEILPAVLRLLQDPEPHVRLATTHALSRIAEEMFEVLETAHEQLFAVLIKNLDELQTPSADKKTEGLRLEITAGICSALDNLILGLDKEDAVRYLPELSSRLYRLFDSEDENVKMVSITALASLSSPCQEEFIPIFDKVMHKLSPFMSKKESNDELRMRSIVSDALGTMMNAVGPKAAQAYVQPMMAASEEALKLDSSNLRESSFILWATLSKIYKAEFAHFVDGCVKALVESLDQDEFPLDQVTDDELQETLGPDVSVDKKVAKAKISAALTGEDVDWDTVDIEDLGIDGDEWDDFTVSTAIAEEKETAMEAIGDIMTNVKQATLKYVPQIVDKALVLVDHPYDGVKKASVTTLWRIYALCWQLSEENGSMEKWQPGVPVKVQPTADLLALGAKILPSTLSAWTDELDRDVVTEINRNLAETLKLCGPGIFQDPESLNTFTVTLAAIVQKQHPCQLDPYADEDTEDEDDQMSAEYDWEVIDSALDVIANLAKAVGPHFAGLWKLFQKHMIKHAGSSSSVERSTSIGAIAECIQGMGVAVTPHTTPLLKIIIHRLSDEDFDTRANAAFAAGILCASSTSDAEILGAYPKIFSKLQPCLSADHQTPRLLDNAAGCVARMIMKHPDNVPLDDALPVLVGILPLQEDYEENEAVWPMIVKLYQMSNETVIGLSEQIVPAVAKVLSPPDKQLSTETRSSVVQLVKFLHQKQPALLANDPVLIQAAQS